MNPITTILLKVLTNVYFYVFLLCIALSISVTTCKHNAADKALIQQNTDALLNKVNQYSNQLGENTVTVQRLSLTVKEYKDYKSETTKKLDSLNIKINRFMMSVSESEWKVKYYIETRIKDSIRTLAGKIDTLHCISFNDQWLTINGCNDNGLFSGGIEDLIPIIQTVQRVPHHFWFIKWGTKAVTQSIHSTNPYAKVTYDEYIEFTK